MKEFFWGVVLVVVTAGIAGAISARWVSSILYEKNRASVFQAEKIATESMILALKEIRDGRIENGVDMLDLDVEANRSLWVGAQKTAVPELQSKYKKGLSLIDGYQIDYELVQEGNNRRRKHPGIRNFQDCTP